MHPTNPAAQAAVTPAPSGMPEQAPVEACGALARPTTGVWLCCQQEAGHGGPHVDGAATWPSREVTP